MFIHLGLPSRASSSCLPESDAGSIIAFLFGIAPDKAFLAILVTKDTGSLLHYHFTLANHHKGERRFVSVELALHCCSFPLGSIPPCGVRTFLCAKLRSEHLFFPVIIYTSVFSGSTATKRFISILPQFSQKISLRISCSSIRVCWRITKPHAPHEPSRVKATA